MTPWLTEHLGSIVIAIIGLGGAAVTARASSKSTRTQAEEGAYVRAETFYKGVIERQDAERAEDQAEIRELKNENATQQAELRDLKAGLEECRRACRALARRTGDPNITVTPEDN